MGGDPGGHDDEWVSVPPEALDVIRDAFGPVTPPPDDDPDDSK